LRFIQAQHQALFFKGFFAEERIIDAIGYKSQWISHIRFQIKGPIDYGGQTDWLFRR